MHLLTWKPITSQPNVGICQWHRIFSSIFPFGQGTNLSSLFCYVQNKKGTHGKRDLWTHRFFLCLTTHPGPNFPIAFLYLRSSAAKTLEFGLGFGPKVGPVTSCKWGLDIAPISRVKYPQVTQLDIFGHLYNGLLYNDPLIGIRSGVQIWTCDVEVLKWVCKLEGFTNTIIISFGLFVYICNNVT